MLTEFPLSVQPCTISRCSRHQKYVLLITTPPFPAWRGDVPQDRPPETKTRIWDQSSEIVSSRVLISVSPWFLFFASSDAPLEYVSFHGAALKVIGDAAVWFSLACVYAVILVITITNTLLLRITASRPMATGQTATKKSQSISVHISCRCIGGMIYLSVHFMRYVRQNAYVWPL